VGLAKTAVNFTGSEMYMLAKFYFSPEISFLKVGCVLNQRASLIRSNTELIYL